VDFIQKLPYTRGTTNTAAALDMAVDRMFNNDRSNPPNIAVVLTDGGSNEKQKTIESAIRAKKNMIVLTIGIGDWTDTYELRASASDPYEVNYWKVDRFDTLKTNDFRTRLRNFICNSEYTTTTVFYLGVSAHAPKPIHPNTLQIH
jgi:hypothetical protein